MARITDISDSGDFESPRYTMQGDGGRRKTVLISAAVVLLIALIAGGVYYVLWQKKQTLDQTRLKVSTDFESTGMTAGRRARGRPRGKDPA